MSTIAPQCCASPFLPSAAACLSETAERRSIPLQSDVVVTSKLKAALGLAQLHNKKYKMAAKRFTEVGAACPSLVLGGLGLPNPKTCAASLHESSCCLACPHAECSLLQGLQSGRVESCPEPLLPTAFSDAQPNNLSG